MLGPLLIEICHAVSPASAVHDNSADVASMFETVNAVGVGHASRVVNEMDDDHSDSPSVSPQSAITCTS